MYKILTLNKIAACGTDLFDRSRYVVTDMESEPDGYFVGDGYLELLLSCALKLEPAELFRLGLALR